MTPDFSIEQTKLKQGKTCIIGVDEVGRGPWAGPVVAAAVWVDPTKIPFGANDSKKLSAKKRELLAKIIMRDAKYSIGEATVEEIDSINIREATFLAMERAIEGLNLPVDYIYVDGNALPNNLPCEAETVVKGDSKVLSIACASIVAKVYRDKMMVDLASEYPHYAWERNAGYGTKAHQEGLAKYGVTAHHRQSFKPIKILLEA